MNFEGTIPRPFHSKSRVCPLRRQDSGPQREVTAAATGVVRCCCCCGLGTRVHTKPVPLTSGSRGYTLYVEGHCKLRRPWHLPSDSDRAQTPRSTTGHILQGGFTAKPARCWTALYGVDCLSVRVAKAVSLCLARASSRRVCSMSRQAARS